MTESEEKTPETPTTPSAQIRYERGKLLGRGQVADVFLATQFSGPDDKTGRKVALKVIDLGDILTASVASAADEEEGEEEIRTMKQETISPRLIFLVF